MPLAWYFRSQWQEAFGDEWAGELCNNWINTDRHYKNFAHEVNRCPCTVDQAVANRGAFAPDFDCDMDGNTNCFFHSGASHCVRTGMPK